MRISDWISDVCSSDLNQTLASITFQNYFRMYPKLSGMTGTAATEAAEFFDIYKMNVVNIPTNRPIARIDDEDEFYKNITDKFGAIAKTIRESNERGKRSEEHTSELQSLMRISYAVFCLTKKKQKSKH